MEQTLFFKDGIRRIDYVLAYDKETSESKKAQKRQVFEDNLRNEGLQLEEVVKEVTTIVWGFI